MKNKIIIGILFVFLFLISSLFGGCSKLTSFNLGTLTITGASTVQVNQTQQFHAFYKRFPFSESVDVTSEVVWSSSTKSSATISSTGLVRGIAVGETKISAIYNESVSNIINVIVTNGGGGPIARFVYVPFLNSINYILARCEIDGLNVSNCVDANETGYAPDNFGTGIAINGTHAYLLNANAMTPANANIMLCNINDADGIFTSCQPLNTGSMTFSNGYGIAVQNNFAYVIEAGGPIFSCPILGDGTFDSGACQIADSSVSQPLGIGLKNFAYVSSGSSVYYCIINGATLISCLDSQASGLTSPFGIAFNGSKAYISDPAGGGVFVCNMNPDGTLTPCISANLTGQTSVFQIAINNNNVFVTDFDGLQNINIIACNISSDGTFNNCQTNLVGSPLLGQPPFGIGLY